ncbi:hypothetical protein V8F20_004371 [Naviculisporaceae sp. PSN 640]
MLLTNTLLLLLSGIGLARCSALPPVAVQPDGKLHAFRHGDKVYAQKSDTDLGHGTTIFKGIKYAFHAPPATGDMQNWYISNSNGTEAPHWKYLPNMKARPMLDSENEMPAVPANNDTSLFVPVSTESEGSLAIEKRQRPPAYMNYYNLHSCQDWDAQDNPVTLNRCVWNRALVAWSSSFTPAPFDCRYIVNYYNSGCGFQATCGGYITQTFDYAGCFTPPRVFCSTFATCCLSGC